MNIIKPIYMIKNIGIIPIDTTVSNQDFRNMVADYLPLDTAYKIHIIPYCSDEWRHFDKELNGDTLYDDICSLIEQNHKAKSIIIHINKNYRKHLNERLLSLSNNKLIKFSYERTTASFRFSRYILVGFGKGYALTFAPSAKQFKPNFKNSARLGNS